MKDALKYLLKLFFFFYLLFFIERIIFLLFAFTSLKGISPGEILFAFRFGFSMDVSTCSYLLAPAFLFISVFLFTGGKIIPRLLKYYVTTIIILSGFINLCDIALYQSWGTRINQ